MGICKTPVHNILQKLLIIRLVNFAKGRKSDFETFRTTPYIKIVALTIT